MKIVIAPDSFKGSLTAPEAASAIAEGIKKGLPRAELCVIPVADGGEGTLAAMAPGDSIRTAVVTGPCGKPVNASYAVKGDLGIVEMAAAAGLTLAPEPRCAGKATTYGVGELIRECLGAGCKRILLTAGGSATNDGGSGMLSALGARFIGSDGEFVPTGLTLSKIREIDVSGLSGAFRACHFTVAADVVNTLLGEKGATMVFAPQKGASAEELGQMEAGMAHYAELLCRMTGRNAASVRSSGAAGGIAVPIISFARCDIQSGIQAVLNAAGFDRALQGADAVITGEGRLDSQSFYGKAVSGIAKRAAVRGIPVYAFAGCLGSSPDELKKLGLADVLSISELADGIEDSMENAAKYLRVLGNVFALGLGSRPGIGG